ncbi:unnamed protein product [Parajaminaea phylloscopi]
MVALTLALLFPLLSAPALATSLGLFSCAKDSFQLSCHARTNISSDSCCFNGPLTNSSTKQSGLILATQFWNAQPSFGPIDSTTVHGLWPDYCDGTYPQYCTKDSGIPEYTGPEIRAILQRYDPYLLDYMNEFYKTNQGDDADFWSHEANKHGTCYNTLKLHCQKPRHGQTAGEAYIVHYFREIVLRFQKLPTYRWLAHAGIKPSNTTTYTLAQIESALERRFGAKPYIGCSKGNQLNEFWYFTYTHGPLVGGRYVPTDSTTKSSCNATEIRYLPKN